MSSAGVRAGLNHKHGKELRACVSNTSKSLCLRVLITASAGREPYKTLTKLRRSAGRQARKLGSAVQAAHIESLSFADMRVTQPMNEMQACNRTTLPMSCTCICPARIRGSAALRSFAQRTRHQKPAKHGTDHEQYNEQHRRHAGSRAVKLRKLTLSPLGGQAGDAASRTWRAKLRRMHNAVSQIAGCTTRLRRTGLRE